MINEDNIDKIERIKELGYAAWVYSHGVVLAVGEEWKSFFCGGDFLGRALKHAEANPLKEAQT